LSKDEKKGQQPAPEGGGDALFQELFDGTPEAAALTQGEVAVFRSRVSPRSYDFMTPGIEALTGYPAQSFTPDLWDSIVEKVKPRGELAGMTFEEARRRYYEGKVSRWSAECLIRHRTGEQRWILDLKVPLRDGDGKVTGSFGFLQDITAQRHTRVLQAGDSHPGISSLDVYMPTILWTTDAELRFLTSDGSGLKFLGLRPGEVVGRTIREFFGNSPDAEQSITAHLKALEGHASSYVQTWLGRTFAVHLEPIRRADDTISGVLGMAADVTTQREVEKRLEQNEAYERALLQAIPDLIAVLDAEGTYLDFKAETRLAGLYPPEAVIGRSMNEMSFHEADLPAIWDAIRNAIKTGDVQHIEYRFIEGGRETWWDARIARLDANRVVAVSRDITERKDAEEERRRIEEEMRSAQQLESLGVLAGGIAHDFNNLLVGILGNAELFLKELKPDDAAADGVNEIRHAATRAAELTNLMLAYAGRGKFQTAVLDLNVVACEVTQLIQAAVSKKIVIHFELDRALPPVRGDVAQIRQVVMNLIINAAEAIGDREGSIFLHTGLAEIGVPQVEMVMPSGEVVPGRYVFLEVRDTGSGMDSVTRRRIFDPFFTTKFTGRGLGLSAALGILRSHKGAIHLESEKGRGSTFTIFLPPASITETAADATVILPAMPPPAADTTSAKNRILVVDDEEVVRRVVKRQLERAGFSVLTEQDGRRAVQLIADQPELIDCVLLDLTMPGMGGEEVLLYLRNVGFRHPVVLMSGYDESEAASIGHKLGANAFLRKPFQNDLLISTIRSAIARGGDNWSASTAIPGKAGPLS